MSHGGEPYAVDRRKLNALLAAARDVYVFAILTPDDGFWVRVPKSALSEALAPARIDATTSYRAVLRDDGDLYIG
jgi:hypothetical protein